MTPFDAITLGLVQGLTEFLPVSSSGHLILARELLGIGDAGGLAFDASLHLATALAIIIYFWKDLCGLVRDRRMIVAIIVGSIPAVLVGALYGDAIERTMRTPMAVAVGLLVGSAIILIAEYVARRLTSRTETAPSWIQALGIGLFQMLALMPGMSRSGMSIAGGMLSRFSRESAARFAFLLALPIILGAGGMKAVSLFSSAHSAAEMSPLALGGLFAFLSGLLAISALLKLLRTQSLIPFVIYRVLLAIVIIVLAL